MTSLFEQCAERLNDGSTNNNSLLLCISDQYDVLARQETAAARNIMEWLLTLCGGSVFFMQAGFAMVAAGAVRKKNVQNTMLKNLLDACGASLAFYIIGYGLAYGDNGRDDIQHNTFVGNSHFFGLDWQQDNVTELTMGFYFFQYVFSASSVTIVAGTLAERCRMGAYLLYSFYLPGWIFPVIVHAMWSDHGYLSPTSPTPLRGVGVVDFSGGGVVHLTGGTVALVATLILGARQGRFRDAAGNLLAKPRAFPAYSLALQELGTFILWFGWFGFNAGSALLLDVPENTSGRIATHVAANTAISGAVGGLSACLIGSALLSADGGGEAMFSDLVSTMNGVLSGLVAVTAGGGTMELWGAVITGGVAGILYLIGNRLLIRCRIDDVVDSIPVHMVNGAWGMIACGLFSTKDRLQLVYGIDKDVAGRLLVNQLIGVVAIITWCVAMAVPFFLALSYLGILRSNVVAEVIGLDVVNLDSSKRGKAISGDIQQDIDTFRNELDRSRNNNNPNGVAIVAFDDDDDDGDDTKQSSQPPEHRPPPVSFFKPPNRYVDDYDEDMI